jgi:hypothetical protein
MDESGIIDEHTGEVAMAVNPSMEERDIEMLNRIP